MSQGNELAVMRQSMSLNEIYSIGDVFAKSGFFTDARDQAKAIVKIMAGSELGMQPFESMQNLHIIQGKPTLAANAMAAAVKASPKYDYKVVQLDDEACELKFFEGAVEIGTSRFTKADAAKAGTQNMAKFGRNMMFARCMSNGVRWYCPDVFKTAVYTPEEMGATVDGEGNIIDVPHVEASEPVAQPETNGHAAPVLATQADIDTYAELLGEYFSMGGKKEGWPQYNTQAPADLVAEAIEVLKQRIAKRKEKQAPAEPQTLHEAVAQKQQEAAANGNPEEEAVFEQDDPDPETTSKRSHVKAFFATATAKGLPTTNKTKPARIAAVNAWLASVPYMTPDGKEKLQVESMNDLPNAILGILTSNVESGNVTW